MAVVSSPLAAIGIAADPELTRVIDIAAHVGDVSGDDVNVSYTSLLIGLLWGGDRTSIWLQDHVQPLGIRVDAIYGQRNHPEKSRAAIAERIAHGVEYARRPDFFSISARTVLQEAQSVAHETKLLQGEPIGTRHLAAAYFFRNPPGHDRQFHVEWGFETDAWRRAFAEFIERQYAGEAEKWASLLSGYVHREPTGRPVAAEVLGSYVFEIPALRLLRTVESAALRADSHELGSERLLDTIAAIRSNPDCETFAELVAPRLGISAETALADNTASFGMTATHLSPSRGFKNILDRARTLSRSITGTERIGIRHIIASMVVAPDSMANRRLVKSGVSVPLLRQKLLKDFTRRWLNDDGVQWRFHLIGLTPPTVAGFNADAADKGEDKLDVARYATAFAVVLAADKVTPPLSIGIFGDWGSGKSFFMRLMQEQIARVVASGATDPDGQPLFCRRVLPIRFNAWHYADRNLWATLVQTIFVTLRAAMVGDQGDSDLMDRVIAKLEATKVARKDAEARVARAQEAEKSSRTKLSDTRARLAQKEAEIEKIRAADVVATLRSVVLKDVHLEQAVTVAQTYLGIEGVQEIVDNQKKTTGQVLDLVNESRIVTARSRSTIDWLARAPVKREELMTLAGVSLAVLAAGTFVAIRYRDEINAAWPLVSAAFVQGGAVVALVTAWARRHLSTISRGLDQFDTVRVDLEARVAARQADAGKDVATAEAEHRAAADAVAQAQAELDAAQAAVEDAERQAVESRSAHRIAQLVEQRVTGKQYEQYLGLIDAIRKDFQSLTDLMKQLRLERGAGPADGELPIDRIVLYIDDLDRCPSKTVVAVLEAIHLLLAFELFVVVVGVDVRWAARSLNDRYPNHLSTGKYQGTAAVDANGEGASALDYLEKIFQVPFWLPPMDEQASRNMIADLVPRPKEEGDDTPRPEAAGGSATASQGRAPAPAPAPVEEQPSAGIAAKAEPLRIESEERSYMLSLAEAVGKSPRRLKRFVNTYRIFKGSIDALARETFVIDSGRGGEYRAPMTLLALVTGAPRTSLAVLQDLAAQTDDEPFDQFSSRVSELVASDEASYAEAAFRAYRTAVPDPKLTVRELRHWMPQVTRFSFRSGGW